jgi:hypothetical protein
MTAYRTLKGCHRVASFNVWRIEPMKHLRADLDRAKRIARTLGIRPAAGFMRNRGWSIESALYVLLGIASRG